MTRRKTASQGASTVPTALRQGREEDEGRPPVLLCLLKELAALRPAHKQAGVNYQLSMGFPLQPQAVAARHSGIADTVTS